jgi:predicted nucleotidyltransferase
MKLSDEQISIIRDYFRSKPILKAYVFGSYARGDANETSDIDLLITLDSNEKIGLKYISMQLDLEDLLNRKIDFTQEDRLKPIVKKFVERDKQLVYERSNS